jgi:hypothetical protein
LLLAVLAVVLVVAAVAVVVVLVDIELAHLLYQAVFNTQLQLVVAVLVVRL